MKLRSLFRALRDQLKADFSSFSYASRAGINPFCAATPPAAAAEGEVRSGAEVPGTAPWPGEDPRRGVPRDLPQARHLMELIAGDGCMKFRGDARCWEDPDLSPNSVTRSGRWCDACTARAALDALDSPIPSPRADVAPRGEVARPGSSPTGGDVCEPGRAFHFPS